MKHVELLAVVALLTAGCAAKKLTPEQAAELANTTPSCREAQECSIKWAAARNWLLANAATKIQIATDDLLETYNPKEHDTGLGVRIAKEPRQDGSIRFSVATWCNNMFGCRMDQYTATKSFNDFVNISWSNK